MYDDYKEYCAGVPFQADIDRANREAEYREARERIKHNKRMADLDRRQKFGVSGRIPGMVALIVMGGVIGFFACILFVTVPLVAQEQERTKTLYGMDEQWDTLEEASVRCKALDQEITVFPNGEWVCAEPGTVTQP